MVVAIDGPAGAGKSTIARYVAEKYGYFNLNSGNFYRAITLAALLEEISPLDEDKVLPIAEEASLDIKNGSLHLNGNNVESKLHTDEIDKYVAELSAIVPIRTIVNDKIREISKNLDLVAEGRDMTTVVFPNAEVKIYLDASIDSRTSRRFDQNISDLDKQAIKDNLAKRDNVDKNKPVGRLQIAKDAVYLDTSDLTLDEVCEKVSLIILEKNDSQENGSIMADKENVTDKTNQTQMQEQYLEAMDKMEEGDLVQGEIVQIDGDNAYIDIGYKSEGKIPLEDFDDTPKIGEEVEVVLVKMEGKNGQLVVSKKKADFKKIWKVLRDNSENEEPVKGKIVKSIKGGFEVNLGSGIKAFLPISQTDLVKVDNPDEYIGVEDLFLIERLYQEKKTNIVVSRRKWLEINADKNKAEFFENVHEGDIVKGVVKSFTSFGAFIDLGGFDGLLHINDMGWGHVTKPKEYVKKGDEIELKVIQIDYEDKKINLSLKEMTPNPWDSFENKFGREDIVNGRVTKLTDFGAFIEIENGIEGLAHISELSWVKRIKHPKEVLNVGDEVEVMILDYDLDAQKISLGVKQVQNNPWEEIESKFPIGKKLKSRIIKVINSGAFLELEDGIEGFLHIDDYSWTQKIKNPSSVLKEDEEIEVVVINVNNENRKIRLGVKQLSEDPWKLLQKAHPKGSIIQGEITSKTDFGLFVKVQGDIEGLIHKNNLLLQEGENPENILDRYNVGDSIKGVVVEVNAAKKKLALSERELKRQEERQEISQYLHDDDEEEASTFTLGDMINND